GRRLHTRAALLHQLRTRLVRKLPSGNSAFDRTNESALACAVPGKRRSRKSSGISQSILVQSGHTDGARKNLHCVVREPLAVASGSEMAEWPVRGIRESSGIREAQPQE